jgi:recombination protein RecR
MPSPDPLAALIKVLARLPGVGRRSAERMAIRLARDSATFKQDLVAALRAVEEQVTGCSACGNLTLKSENPCLLCTDPRRDRSVVCVVEDPGDIALIEKAGSYRGLYHAMLGKLSPMRGEGVPSLRLQSLLKRIDQEGVKEIILALNADVESDATASYLHEVLGSREVAVSRLALGLPAGGGVSYADPLTLSRAIQGRQPL